MDASEKSVARARLIASGIIRYCKLETAQKVNEWLEVLAEEFANIKEQNEVLKIRGDLERYALRVPELRIPVHVGISVATGNLEETTDGGATELCSGMTKDNSQGLPVHPAVALDPQVKRNTGTSQTERMVKILTKLYPQGTDCNPVHHAYASAAEIQQNTEHGPAESPDTRRTKGVTKGDAQRGGQPQVNDPTGSWTWRSWNYHRVPPAIEQAVYEKSKQGWSKCKLAREFRLNRRTIIRICREYGDGGLPEQ